MSYRVAAIGDRESVFPFFQVGIETFLPAAGGEVALCRQVACLARDGYALVFICEDCFTQAPRLLTDYDKEPRVALIPIPCLKGNTGVGKQRIQNMVEKALGKNIL